MSLEHHYERNDVQNDTAAFNKAVGELLRKSRHNLNLSQQEVGNRLDLSQDTISKHEKGAEVSAYRLREFARIYEKPVSFFYMAGIRS